MQGIRLPLNVHDRYVRCRLSDCSGKYVGLVCYVQAITLYRYMLSNCNLGPEYQALELNVHNPKLGVY